MYDDGWWNDGMMDWLIDWWMDGWMENDDDDDDGDDDDDDEDEDEEEEEDEDEDEVGWSSSSSPSPPCDEASLPGLLTRLDLRLYKPQLLGYLDSQFSSANIVKI